MKILSIDVGIKNLAYCLMENKDNKLEILDWKVLNLINKECKCNFNLKNNEKCNKNAKYYINEEYYCGIHSKKTNYFIENKYLLNYKKLKIVELLDYCKKYEIYYDNIKNFSKNEIYKLIEKKLENNILKEIKTKSANSVDLIDIGISLMKTLNENLDLSNIDKVLIENQISPIANKMKCIQGMISQYFIMNNINNIQFVSSINKLKDYTGKKTSYSERKKLSVQITEDILKNNNLDNWILYYNNKDINKNKKDDLADSFLQGLWYLKSNKLII